MIVDKKEIQKAKEKLGDRNAYIMASLLELDDFDEKNLKALCPYHDEDTPSFVYDRKRYCFHCFGCNKSVDIIDVLVERGKTFLEACEYLFEQAGISYSFGEKDVATKRAYRYPHKEKLTSRDKVIEYLGKRGISKRVIDYLDIREDEHGNCVFNYYDTNDVLTLVKYRPSHTIDKTQGQIKTWCQKDSDTAPILFNMNRVNSDKTLLITEGELDAASAICAGYINTVSVPFGAGNFHWIEENWNWLEQFNSIVVWADNDEPGEKMRKECIYRLGTWRTRYVRTPEYYDTEDGKRFRLNDINDCLQVGGNQLVLDLIANARDVPVSSVIDYSNVKALNVSDMDGIVTGLKPIDKELMKIFYGTLTILSGRPAAGKTSIADQIIANCMDDDHPAFLFSKEMPNRLTVDWLNTILAGRRNMETAPNGYMMVPNDVAAMSQKYYENKLLIYKDEEPNDVESVMRSAEDCVRKYGVKLVVLDNLMMIDLECSENETNNKQKEFINRLIGFSGKYNVAVLLIAHPRKTQDSNSDIEMYDIMGTSAIINLAHRSIGLRRVSEKEKEDGRKWGKYDVVLTIIKDRLLGKTGKQLGLWYDLPSRRFYTDYDEYDHQYRWDDKTYMTKLPYKDRSDVERFDQ